MSKIIITGIYGIFLPSGRSYIGMSKDVNERFESHKRTAKAGPGSPGFSCIHAAIRKYGSANCIFRVLEECEKSLLAEREIFWIKELNSISPFGYNLTEGGYGVRLVKCEEHRRALCVGHSWSEEQKANFIEKMKGHEVSEETKKKIAASLEGRKRPKEVVEKVSKALKGRKLSKEAIEKRTLSRRGYEHSEETKQKIGNANKNRVLSEEQKEAIRKVRTGSVQSEATKEKRKLTWQRKRKQKNEEYPSEIDVVDFAE